MPSSDPRTISAIVHRAIGISPKSVLDLGIGYGKYGVLLREYIDYNFHEEPNVKHRIKIVGVEGYRHYEHLWWSAYSQVRVENFGQPELWREYAGFDLVLLIDSLEHLEDETAESLLKHLRAHNRNVLVSVPDGNYPQGSYAGNELECHRSTWSTIRLERLGAEVFCRAGVCAVGHFRC